MWAGSNLYVKKAISSTFQQTVNVKSGIGALSSSAVRSPFSVDWKRQVYIYSPTRHSALQIDSKLMVNYATPGSTPTRKLFLPIWCCTWTDDVWTGFTGDIGPVITVITDIQCATRQGGVQGN